MGEISITFYPVTKSNAESILLTSRSGLNTFPRDGLFACFPFPFSALSYRFRDGEPSSEGSVSPAALERRGRSWIVVVVVVIVVIPDAVSEAAPPPAAANTEADVDAAAALEEPPSAKGEPCSGCSSGSGGDDGGVPHDSRTVTVDVIVFALGVAGILELCVGAEDAMAAPWPFSSRARACLPTARRFPGNGPSSPSSLRTSIARATPRPRRPSIIMSERVRTMPPALTVLVVTPELWNGSTLGAVRSAGESTERRPMLAPGMISLGRRLCSDIFTLEKVEEEVVGRMRLWG
jgi:hypothetical protein